MGIICEVEKDNKTLKNQIVITKLMFDTSFQANHITRHNTNHRFDKGLTFLLER